MTRFSWMIVRLLIVSALGATGCSQADEDAEATSAELAIGAPAPPFNLVGSDGNTYRLEEYVGHQAVVIAWFPKAFTGG